MPKVQLRGEMVWMAQAPVSELVFGAQQERHEWPEHIMQRAADKGGELAAPEKRREQQREQCLDSEQWRKAEKDSDGKSERD